MGQVSWDVCEREVAGAYELNWGTLEHCIVLFAYEPGVFDRFLDNVVDVCLGADDAYVVVVALVGVERDMLADEEADADAGHVESV